MPFCGVIIFCDNIDIQQQCSCIVTLFIFCDSVHILLLFMTCDNFVTLLMNCDIVHVCDIINEL